MARDISGESYQDVIDMIELWQEEIDLVLADDTQPYGVIIGWTDESGEYVETGRNIKVSSVAKIHNEGLSNGHGGFHQEHRYLERTAMWLEDNMATEFTQAALQYMLGNQGKAVGIIQDIGRAGKEYLQDLLFNYNLIDTHRLINSIIIKYTDKNGNVLGG